MDPVLFRQEFFGSCEQLVGAVFPAFSDRNICQQVHMGTLILVGMDFTMNTLSAVIAQIQGNNLCILDDMVLHDSDTNQMCQSLPTGSNARNHNLP